MEESEQVLARFNRLIREVQNGRLTRNCFHPWEVELLLDLENYCAPHLPRRWQLLDRYQRMVKRKIENGESHPMKFSEFLRQRRRRAPCPDVP